MQGDFRVKIPQNWDWEGRCVFSIENWLIKNKMLCAVDNHDYMCHIIMCKEFADSILIKQLLT